MPQILLVVIAVLFVSAFYFVIRCVNRKEATRANNAAASWQRADKVGELVTLYLDMALRYGPNSSEAKSFRFGVTNSELWGGENSEALATFEEIARHFDNALIRNRKMFYWKKS